ncbi:hypothetical protein ANANG_G00147620 [Anguilla anguilla]|uniref:SAP domain-containing protein n=1 Tax=Anguilla anguilla TaxID=7936 RepID=A0A9D3ME03_ANGAN|nr:hypothetical protein ANANG_G00147620 [Anguilla anguilla]
MAELEDVTLDGKPLHSLRVADLKSALEQRGLPKSGQKNALIKRLKGALMLENLQRTSSPHMGLQPNSQIGEEMSQNSFIKQYLAKQQELLRQRLEREAREVAEADDSPADPDDDDHTKSSDITSCTAERAEEVMSAEACCESSLGPLALPAPHSGPQLISSAQDDSDDDEDSDEEWGVGMGPGRSQPTWETLRCKQRPPWHVPPQLQQPTPPHPSPCLTPPNRAPGLERPQGVAGGRGWPNHSGAARGHLGKPKN